MELEFELTYYDVAVQHICHNFRQLDPRTKKLMVMLEVLHLSNNEEKKKGRGLTSIDCVDATILSLNIIDTESTEQS